MTPARQRVRTQTGASPARDRELSHRSMVVTLNAIRQVLRTPSPRDGSRLTSRPSSRCPESSTVTRVNRQGQSRPAGRWYADGCRQSKSSAAWGTVPVKEMPSRMGVKSFAVASAGRGCLPEGCSRRSARDAGAPAYGSGDASDLRKSALVAANRHDVTSKETLSGRSDGRPLCGPRPPDRSNDRGPTMPTQWGDHTPALGSDS